MTIIARIPSIPTQVIALNMNVSKPCIIVENDNPKAMDHNQIAPIMMRNGIISVSTMRGFKDVETATGDTDGYTDGDTEWDTDGETDLVESIGETTGEEDIIIR